MNFKGKRIVLFLLTMILGISILSGCTGDSVDKAPILNEVDSIKDNVTDVTDKVKDLEDRVSEHNKPKNLEKMQELEDEAEKERYDDEVSNITKPNNKESKESKSIDTIFEAHFIDVGQGDAIFLVNNDKTLLIDAGNNGDGQAITSYIKSLGYNHLNYVIGTHPHADHIGGMADVLNGIKTDEIFLPSKSHTTKTYERMLLAIQSNNIKATIPDIGDVISLGDAKVTFLSPGSQDYYDNLNNYSIVVKVDHGNNSFLFMGDAEKEIEGALLGSGFNLRSNVLKVGHHGSSTSSTASFISAVNPDISVITVGLGNKYGHPHNNILSRLTGSSKVMRTDELGHIIIKSDGQKLITDNKEVSKKANTSNQASAGSYVEPETKSNKSSDTSSDTVWVTKTGSKYHLEDCKHAQKSGTPSSLSDAKAKGLTPCKVCNP